MSAILASISFELSKWHLCLIFPIMGLLCGIVLLRKDIRKINGKIALMVVLIIGSIVTPFIVFAPEPPKAPPPQVKALPGKWSDLRTQMRRAHFWEARCLTVEKFAETYAENEPPLPTVGLDVIFALVNDERFPEHSVKRMNRVYKALSPFVEFVPAPTVETTKTE